MNKKISSRTVSSRRDIFRALIAAPAALPLMAAGNSFAQSRGSADLTLVAATMGLISSNVCAVMPETTEGPYYIDPKLVRQDIREDKKGIPLRMQIQVVTADCRPLASARVDIWHCDAQGDYSGYANMGAQRNNDTTGQTFLRGTQLTDANGIATFETIYPGWYRGRTTHIHYKIFLDDKTVLTSQIFFPDALSEYIYLKSSEYKRSEERDTVNSIDGIAAQAGEGSYCSIREQKDRYIAALVVGVDPEAQWTEQNQGMNGFGPGGRPGGPPGPDASGNKRGQKPEAPPPMPSGARNGPPPGPPPGGFGGGGPRQRDDNTRMFPGA